MPPDTPDILRKILARKAEEITERSARVSMRELGVRVAGMPPPRPFADALRARVDEGRAAVIAEIKRASPSKGLLREDFEPAVIAREYEAGGDFIASPAVAAGRLVIGNTDGTLYCFGAKK